MDGLSLSILSSIESRQDNLHKTTGIQRQTGSFTRGNCHVAEPDVTPSLHSRKLISQHPALDFAFAFTLVSAGTKEGPSPLLRAEADEVRAGPGERPQAERICYLKERIHGGSRFSGDVSRRSPC